MDVRAREASDRPWLREVAGRAFGSPEVASLGRLFDPCALPGLVAWEGGRRAGILAYAEEAGGAEVVLLAADPPGRGAGTALLAAVEALGRARGWARLRLVTTNDNTPALAFFQRRGWDLVELHRGAVAADRGLKPQIPAVGMGGIPLRHALELELRLDAFREDP